MRAPVAKPNQQQKRAQSPTLARGPAMAIESSSEGVPGSPVISEAPANGQKDYVANEQILCGGPRDCGRAHGPPTQTKSAAIQPNGVEECAGGQLVPRGNHDQGQQQREAQWRRIGTPFRLPIRNDLPSSCFLFDSKIEITGSGSTDRFAARGREPRRRRGRQLRDHDSGKALRRPRPRCASPRASGGLWSGYLVATLGSQLTVVRDPVPGVQAEPTLRSTSG